MFADEILIAGTGNVAWHLAKGLKNHFRVLVTGRSQEKILELCNATGAEIWDGKSRLPVILCVSDDAISGIAAELAQAATLMVHTAGSVNLDVLEGFCKNRGVFWPLQTISKSKDLAWAGVPVAVEASSAELLHFLENLGSTLGAKTFRANTEQRLALHLAAVVASNFTNHIVRLAFDWCNANGVSSELLLPLLREVVAKLEYLSPDDAQTGPARRHDQAVLQKHLQVLQASGATQLMEVYELLSKQIGENY